MDGFSRRFFIAGAVLAVVASAPAIAQSPARSDAGPKRSEADGADIARVETYLAGIKTLEARFLQIGPDGSTAEGKFYLSRPGKLRLDYDAPNPNLLIADGRALAHIDRSLKTISYLPLDSTPAGVLVRADVKLAGDVTVTGIERGPGVLRVGIVQTSDPRAGRLILEFAERPFQLSSWRVIDGQGLTTRITLLDPRDGVTIPPDRFTIVDPNQQRYMEPGK
ncbi:MAG: outer membrane lipoprotein carrier protein LolA [Alphaproteobacteria bacterium]|nr:outer membrane lipoprotein carrier protein LolA [Alphaproteobacteria bacterium]MCA0450424.1 outer membrane lipoprotein carrier protein LolA [Pseudomonadota bacterium]